ncbi:unnamed protein product [Hymenolepis diminuta]|uniref:Uncharacterized protein n=1 Tax=Hymenolepis diminuta TaxID=6216 RepID=A0A564Z0X1_HYMDI|nr:unnamed protein product [Hymenolepis diminuta]
MKGNSKRKRIGGKLTGSFDPLHAVCSTYKDRSFNESVMICKPSCNSILPLRSP